MPAAAAPGGPVERRFLSPEDIQEIRKQELKPGEGASVSIPNDVRRQFAAKAGLTFAQFNQRGKSSSALDILEKGDEDMKKHVRITTDPDAIVAYKRIQPVIISSCATMNCHGSTAGGDFILFPAESDPATYTNFYILSQYAKRLPGSGTGFFGGGQRNAR